jgi:5'-methylthioadenosine phosphorylase
VSDTYRVGVIGGSGLYGMEGLHIEEERRIDTPWGEASDAYLLGSLDGQRVAFLARHGRGHRILPSELNFRANLYGFKTLGVERIVSISAVGSMKIEYAPTHIVVPDQFFDRTRHRPDTFFGDGLVAHVSIAKPVCPDLVPVFADGARAAGATVHQGGTYLCMEGPQFSTRAESEVYREAVSGEAVMEVIRQNVLMAQAVVRNVVARLASLPRTCICKDALQHALITERSLIPAATRRKLQPIIGRYLGE